MPLKKLLLKPGIVTEGTNYSNESGWFSCDKIRFRSGYPEKIGGWIRLSADTFLGIGRSMWAWLDADLGTTYLGIGTSLKYYIEKSTSYFDVTPIRKTTAAMAADPFATMYSTLNGNITATQTSILLVAGATFANLPGVILIGTEQIYYDTVTTNTLSGIIRGYNGTTAATHATGSPVGGSSLKVTDAANGVVLRDFVTFSGSSAVGNFGAAQINLEHQVSGIVSNNVYVITVAGTFATSAATSGGAAVKAEYQVNTGLDIYIFGLGWGAGPWGLLGWGLAATTGIGQQLRLWSNDNYGADLIIAPRGGAIYYWLDSTGVTVRAQSLTVLATAISGADGPYVPHTTLQIIASSVERLVIAFGANPYVSGTPASTFDPLLVRWSDQQNAFQWVPKLTNQAGEYHLSRGSVIIAAKVTVDKILIWTDSTLYAMIYQGPPYVWGFTILQDNISIMSPNAVAVASNIVYWMGADKFYVYTGRVETLTCAVKQFVFDDINKDQSFQVFAGTNEGYNEVWWFYCSSHSTTIDKYVVFNYVDQVWYTGTMARTFWLDSGLRQYPMAINYDNRVLYHEANVDDVSGLTPVAINAYVESSDFDIDDGHNFGFVWRMLPDINFNGSNVNNPYVTITIKPRRDSGTPYGTADSPTVTSADNYTTAHTYVVQEFTGQVYTRLRARQMSYRIESTSLGTSWQAGLLRYDIRQDGRK